jgi:hypothetical protein
MNSLTSKYGLLLMIGHTRQFILPARGCGAARPLMPEVGGGGGGPFMPGLGGGGGGPLMPGVGGGGGGPLMPALGGGGGAFVLNKAVAVEDCDGTMEVSCEDEVALALSAGGGRGDTREVTFLSERALPLISLVLVSFVSERIDDEDRVAERLVDSSICLADES